VVPENLSTRARRDLDKAHLAVFQLNLPFVTLVLCYLVLFKSLLSCYPMHPRSRPLPDGDHLNKHGNNCGVKNEKAGQSPASHSILAN
jgi:hypothetical protein